MFKCRYGKIMFAPDTGADGGAGASGVDGVETETPDTTDWKALYEKEHADKEKLKTSFDKTASEIAELKRQNKAKMTEDEQRQAEQAEREAKYQSMQNELNEIKTSNVFAKQGFNETDYADLSKKLVESCGEHASEVAEIITAFVKKSNQTAVANARNGAVVDGAKPPKASTATKEEHTYANIASQMNAQNNRIDEIKNHYKKS